MTRAKVPPDPPNCPKTVRYHSVGILERHPSTEVKVVPVPQDPEGEGLTNRPPLQVHEGLYALALRQGPCYWLGVSRCLPPAAPGGKRPRLRLLPVFIGKRHLPNARDSFCFWVAEAGLTGLVTEYLPMFTLSLMSSHHSR